MRINSEVASLLKSAGVDLQGQEDAFARFMAAVGEAWVSVQEALPLPGSRVLVAFTTAGGEPGQTEATYHGVNPQIVPDDVIVDCDDETRQMFLEMNKGVDPSGGFGMSGGDWDAYFPAPHFSRKGWWYAEDDKYPVSTITHWRYLPHLPYAEATHD